jgi:hypothetical protein
MKGSKWIRQMIIEKERVEEFVELYKELGMEVKVEDVELESLPCDKCFKLNSKKYKIIYTRKKEEK